MHVQEAYRGTTTVHKHKKNEFKEFEESFFNVAAFTIVCLDKHRGHFYRANPTGVLVTPLTLMRKLLL